MPGARGSPRSSSSWWSLQPAATPAPASGRGRRTGLLDARGVRGADRRGVGVRRVRRGRQPGHARWTWGARGRLATASGSTVTRKATWTTATILGQESVPDRERRGHDAALADMTYSGGFAATGGAIGIRVVGGMLVDAVGWGDATSSFVEGTAAAAPPAGSSFERGRAAGGERNRHEQQPQRLVREGAPSPQGLGAPAVPARCPCRPRSDPDRGPRHAAPPRQRRCRRRRRPDADRRRRQSPTARPADIADSAPRGDSDHHRRRARRRRRRPPNPTPTRPDPDGPHPDAATDRRSTWHGRWLRGHDRGRPHDAARRPRIGHGGFVQDATGGIALYLDDPVVSSWPAGTTVTVEGSVSSRFSQRTLRISESPWRRSAVRPARSGRARYRGRRGAVRGPAGSGEWHDHRRPGPAVRRRRRDHRRWVRHGPCGHRPTGGWWLDPRIRDDCDHQWPAGAARQFRDGHGGISHPRDPGRRTRSGARSDTSPTPTPTATATATVAPTPTATANPTGTPPPTPTPSQTASPTPSPTSTPVTTPLDAVRALPVGSTVRTSGVVTADEGRLGTHSLLAIGDATAGLVVHLPAGSATYARGVRLELTGKLAAPYGQLEIRRPRPTSASSEPAACPRRSRSRPAVSMSRSRAGS